jgi:RNA polymerase sigma-70 factor (ECF subfamily)
MDDAGLLDRARRGDELAFSQLFARYQRAVHRYAVYMCGRDVADDVVQDTFLAVLRQAGRHDSPRQGAVGPYLIGIARHLALKRIAIAPAEARSPDSADVAAVEQPSVLDHLTRAETIDTVRAAVQSLPAAYREAIVLCELEEMDYAAAAIVMQCPIGTVRSRVHRARALLLAKLTAATPLAAARPAERIGKE